MKRYVSVIIIIIVIAVVAIGGIFLFKKNPSLLNGSFVGSLPQVGVQGGGGSNTGQNGSGQAINNQSTTTSIAGATSSFGIVATGPISDYFVTPGNEIEAVKSNGEVILVSNGTTTVVSTSTLNNIIYAKFSSDGSKVLVSFGDPNNPNLSIFDMASKTWADGPKGAQSPSWAPSGYKIAYLSSLGGGSLSLLTIDGANLKNPPSKIITLHVGGVVMNWVANGIFSLSDKSSSQTVGSLWLFNAQTDTMVPAAYEAPGIESIWGGVNNLGLVFQDNSTGKGGLSLVNDNGSLYHPLNFLTMPSKCGFGEATSSVAVASGTTTSTTAQNQTTTPYLYCGVPIDQASFANATLPDDYTMMSLFTSDEIMRVDTVNGAKDVLWNNPSFQIDATDMKKFNNDLFFVNRYDQDLYMLGL